MMNHLKKLMVLFFVGISCVGLVGASIWEGAAAMAAGGELPENGYYIATNSFPRNTMVDVVNLENGKTLRAIVVGGIDTPGLLGILSKEAAAALGLEKGMVGRIRVNMPADPIAFSRYKEELEKTGDPDRDPAAALSLVQAEKPTTVTEDTVSEPQENQIATTIPDATVSSDATSSGTIVLETQEKLNTEPQQELATAPHEEIVEKSEPEQIQELLEHPQAAVAITEHVPMVSSEESLAVSEPVPEELSAEVSVPESVTKAESVSIEAPAEQPAEAAPASTLAAEAAPTENPAEMSVEVSAEPILSEEVPATEALPPEMPQVTSVDLGTEPAPAEVSAEPAPVVADSPAELTPAFEAPAPGSVELSLEPAEERPPVPVSSKPVVKNVAELPETSKIVEAPVAAPQKKPESTTVSEPSPIPVPEIVDKPAVQIAIEKPSVPMVAQEPVKAPSKATEQNFKITFSVPAVTNLDKGKYYIQLGAFTKADAVENQIKGLNKKYPLIVHVGGTTEKPIYRLLIGPLNEGESRALVSYFKKSGFKDAFVKKEG